MSERQICLIYVNLFFNIISDLCIITESIHKTIAFTVNIKFIDITENMA